MWDSVRSLVGGGTTVLLTTQYLEEADQLADRICLVDAGRVVADGTADELKAAIGGDRIDVVLRDAGQLGTAVALLPVPEDAVTVDPDRRLLSAPSPTAWRSWPGSSARWRRQASKPRTSPCAGPRSMRCSCG
ncbi:hypothetical protein RKD28_003390 [Streptomyces sp. SAI-229]